MEFLRYRIDGESSKKFFNLSSLTDSATVFVISRAGLSIVYYADSDWPSLKNTHPLANTQMFTEFLGSLRQQEATRPT